MYLNWTAALAQALAACQQTTDLSERSLQLRNISNLLRNIRDKMIGNSCCKFFFLRHNLLQIVLPLLWLKDESNAEFSKDLVECQKDALILIAALINCNDNSAAWLPETSAAEVFTNLTQLLQSAIADSANEGTLKYMEILSKCLLWFVRKYGSVRNLVFDALCLPVIISLLDPSRSNSATIHHFSCILAHACDAPTKQKILVEARVLTLALAMIQGTCHVDSSGRVHVTDIRLLDGAIEITSALTRDFEDAALVVAAVPITNGLGKLLPSLLFQLLNISTLTVNLKMKISLL